MKNYDDIINLSHHVSIKYNKMSRQARAAQFAPFAALTGYDDAIKETTRYTYNKVDLDEESKRVINEKLQVLAINIQNKPKAIFTYFIKDKKKKGGSYITVGGNIYKIDLINNLIILTNKEKIIINDIIDINL